MTKAMVTEALKTPKSNDSLRARIVRKFRRHKLAQVGLVILILLSIAALLAPYITPYTFDGQDFDLLGQPTRPSAAHIMGTDQLGRDNATRVLYGARVSLLVGLLSALIASSLGTIVGALAGFYGGIVDAILMRFTDVMLSIPLLPLVIVLSGILKPNLYLLVCIIGILGWMGTARLVRSQFLSLRNHEFVEASKALGSGNNRLIFKHILPNALGPILVSTTLTVGSAILLESALSFFGFGVQPPTPTWGNLLNGSSDWLDTAPWLAIFPGIFILVTVLSVNFLGDGLRDALDPRV